MTGAIYHDDDLPAHLAAYKDDNARFFAAPLPGRSAGVELTRRRHEARTAR